MLDSHLVLVKQEEDEEGKEGFLVAAVCDEC